MLINSKGATPSVGNGTSPRPTLIVHAVDAARLVSARHYTMNSLLYHGKSNSVVFLALLVTPLDQVRMVSYDNLEQQNAMFGPSYFLLLLFTKRSRRMLENQCAGSDPVLQTISTFSFELDLAEDICTYLLCSSIC